MSPVQVRLANPREIQLVAYGGVNGDGMKPGDGNQDDRKNEDEKDRIHAKGPEARGS